MKGRGKAATLLLAMLMCSEAAIAGAAPTNDAFSKAKSISALPFYVVESTRGATLESKERQSTCARSSATVWFKIKPSMTGPIGLSTLGSTYDTVIAIWTGTKVSALTQVSCGNNDGTGKQAMAGWLASAGTTYYIQAGSLRGTGTGKLHIHIALGNKIDQEFSAAPHPLLSLSVRFASAASIDPDRQNIAGRSAVIYCVLGGCTGYDVVSVDYQRTSTTGGQVTVCPRVPPTCTTATTP